MSDIVPQINISFVILTKVYDIMTHMEEGSKKRVSKRHGWMRLLTKALWLLLIPLGLLIPVLAKNDPAAVERIYSSKMYPKIAEFISSLTSKTPASIAETLLIVGVLLIVAYLVVGLFRLFMRKIRPVAFLHKIVNLGIIAGVLLILFYGLWGLNYYRPTLSELMELDVRERPTEELAQLSSELATEAASLRAEVSEDGDGVFYLKSGCREYFDMLPEAYASLSEKLDIIRTKATPAKSVRLSYAMSYTGISGIYIPYTAEANVNVDQPPLLVISAAAHEMAHFQGVAREDEANFIAYLVCLESEEPAVRYSGVMNALIYCMNQLYDADRDAYAAVRALYTEGMMRDLTDYNAYWDSFQGPVEEFTDNLNDSYLKFNDQEHGVKSYGMMVDLLLAYRAAQ